MSTMRRMALMCAAATVLGACGQTQMVQTTGQVRDLMLQGNYPGALAAHRQSKQSGAYKEQDRVMFWMEEGMLLHLTGNYKESSEVLTKAERRSKELFTVSISKNVKAAFTSEAATDYAGEDYENVLVHVVKALDFLGLRQVESALVEARKINELLKLYNTKYDKKNIYNQDAFAHWLMGLMFEMEGSYDDARIAYVNAMDVYQNDFAANYGMKPPAFVAEDIVRAALLSGAQDIAEEMRGKYGKDLGGSFEQMKTHGEIVVVHMNGEGPTKSDYVVTCWFRSVDQWACDGEPGEEFIKKTTITIPSDGTVVKVAFPQLNLRPPASPNLVLRVGPAESVSEVALPVNPIAHKNMADKMHRIFRNAIIRIITKTASSKAAGAVGEKVGGGFVGWGLEKGSSAVMQAYEEADKRAWTTLPAQFEVARVRVPPGVHTLSLQLPHGRSGQIPGVKVEAGKRVVVTFRTLP